MNFQADLADKVMAGEKTVTRRVVSDNQRSPWWRGKCALTVGRDYAVCPGRGKHAIGRVKIVSVERWLLEVDGVDFEREARREGFQSLQAFMDAWAEINGSWEPDAVVWRVEFSVVNR